MPSWLFSDWWRGLLVTAKRRLPRNRFALYAVVSYIGTAILWLVWINWIGCTGWMGLINNIAWVAATAAFLTVALRIVPYTFPSHSDIRAEIRAWPLLSVLLSLSFSIIAVGSIALYSFSNAVRNQALNSLETTVRIKANGLSAWLQERRTNAIALAHNSTLRAALEGWLKYSDSIDHDQMVSILENMRSTYGYSSIALFDGEGRVLLGAGSLLAKSDQTRLAAQEAIQTGAVAMVDLYKRSSDNELRLGYMAPVASSEGANLAAIFIEMPPSTYLFPLLQLWPLSESSGETVLLRRDGESALYLNNLRFQQDSALKLRQALNNPQLLTAQAFHVQDGQIAGLDYRNELALAAVSPVSETPWLLLAKVDRAEIVAATSTVAEVTGGLTILALLVATALVWMIWRQHGLQITLKNLDQVRNLEASELRFRTTFEQVAVGMAHLSPDGYWTRHNQRLREMIGRTQMDMRDGTFRDLALPGEQGEETAAMNQLLAGAVPYSHWEQSCQKPDGTLVWLDITASLSRDNAGRPGYFMVVFQDISEKKAAEERAARFSYIYQILSATNQAVTRTKTREGIFSAVCKILVEQGKARLACISRLNSSVSEISILNSYGPAMELLEHQELREWHLIIQQNLAASIEGRQLLECRHYLCNSIREDQSLSPWSELFHNYQINSLAVFPLRESGRAAYALAIYGPSASYFDSEMIKLLEDMAIDISFGLESLAQAQDLEYARDSFENPSKSIT